MKYFKYALFYFFASHLAPFHFKPKKCYVIDRANCRIWNCKYHFKDGKYSDCQKESVGGGTDACM